MPARELVIRLYSDSSTIMNIIDRLEEKDLVKREIDPNDRRMNRIFLTRRSMAILPKIMGLVDGFEKAIYRNLLPREIEALKSGLTKLYRLAEGKEADR